MTIEDITLLSGAYLAAAVIISLLAAFRLDSGLKARLPASRTFMWGFFFGCMGIAFLPLAVLSALAAVAAASSARWAAYLVHGVYTIVFASNVVCGGFILRRRRWAWVLGTFLTPICAFPVLRDLLGPDLAPVGLSACTIWLVNYVYARKRWPELHNQASATAPADHRPFEPVRFLTSLEAKAQRHDVPAQCSQDNTQVPEHSPTLAIPAARSTRAKTDTTERSRATGSRA